MKSQAIEGEKNTISALQVHVSEIDETLTALGKLHEKVHYDAMVPYGKVAMFKGKIILHVLPNSAIYAVFANLW